MSYNKGISLIALRYVELVMDTALSDKEMNHLA